jgi:hypothetical protein
MNNYAPVIISTLNRHIHFKRCVESLALCMHADKTDLFIALDYPLNESHWEGYKIIRAYMALIRGFKTVTVIERNINWGPSKNMIDARNIVFREYDRLIISEDDNVFAPSFLEFVNKGLEVYKNRNDIFSVTGYNSPFPMPIWYQKDAYLRLNFTGWGVGVWRDKWKAVDWSLDSYNAMLLKKDNFKNIKKHYRQNLLQLLEIRDTGIITGDGLLLLYLLHNKMYSIYPTKTRVRNTGHDGSGQHCEDGGDIYMNQEIYEDIEQLNLPADIEEDEKLTKFIRKQRQLTFMENIKTRIPGYIIVKIKKFL